jgi:hypothetical protein
MQSGIFFYKQVFGIGHRAAPSQPIRQVYILFGYRARAISVWSRRASQEHHGRAAERQPMALDGSPDGRHRSVSGTAGQVPGFYCSARGASLAESGIADILGG